MTSLFDVIDHALLMINVGNMNAGRIIIMMNAG